MSAMWEKIFYVCCFVSQGSSYISASTFGIMHRLHHEFADTERDPHSPLFAKGFFHIFLQTRNSYNNIHTGKIRVEEKYKKDLPHWDRFDAIAHHWITRFVWVGIYIWVYITFATAWWMYLFLPITIMATSLQGMIVNWWAHQFGYVNHKMNNFSQNILPLDFLFLGEAYHNNHHKFPGRPNHAHKWFEIDLGYCVLLLLAKVKIIRFKNSGQKG